MLVLRGDPTIDYSAFTPDDMQRILGQYEAWAAKLAAQNLLIDGKKLTDVGGKVVAPQKGGVKIKDGPYVETKEVVGGIYLIRAESYDHAVELTRDHPNLQFGSIEIREIDFMGQPED
jgi:hypothetical protein